MRGYTLIELLAVMVIFAIIFAIAFPVLTNIIEGVRKSAFKASAMNIAQAGNYTYANEFIKFSKRELIFIFNEDNVESSHPDAELSFSGEIPKSGNLILREDGKVALSAHNGTYCVQKDYHSNEFSINELDIEDCFSEVSLPKLVLNGQSPVDIEIHSEYNEEGVTATGIYGDPLTNISKKIFLDEEEAIELQTNHLEAYKIVYSVTEGAKTNFVEREVNIVDTTLPIITTTGMANLTIAEVDGFDFLVGVNVTDNSGETLTVQAIGGISKIAGTYTITYEATDSSGNKGTASRVINVTDIEAPVITLNGSDKIDIYIGDTYNELGATAIDDADGDLTSNIVITGNINNQIAGKYYKTYTVTDSSGNQSSITREITVVDNIAPTVTFSINGNATYGKSRATTVNVTDNVGVISRHYQWTTSTLPPSSASFTQTFTNGSALSSPAGVTGSYYLWIKATDAVGNQTITRTEVFNLDNIVPIITVTNPNVSMTVTTASYTDTGVTALDNIDGNITNRITVTSNLNPRIAGTYTITYNVIDTAGNVAVTRTKTVTVNGYVEYRYRNGTESCSTCHNTCQRSTPASSSTSYSCPSGGNLSGTTCNHSITITSTVYHAFVCRSGSWSANGSSCYGNCNDPCDSGYTNTGGSMTTTCPVTATCINNAAATCRDNWTGTCSRSYAATGTTTYSCPGGYYRSGQTCYQDYSCNPYSCGCTTSWGSWSSWTTTPYTANSTRQVETRQINAL